MKLLNWLRFTWDLRKLAVPAGELPEHYEIGQAIADDETEVRKVVSSSFALDPIWNGEMPEITDAVETWLGASFESDNTRCIVLRHGLRIIGATIVSLDAAAENHLAPGPCILPEYRNRGFGTRLLAQALCALKNAGCVEAITLAKENTPAAKFLYPKFGGVASPQGAPLIAA